MAYLHEEKAEFSTALNLASERFGILPIVAEKDYYVTMILRGLSERLGYVVFKGGTCGYQNYETLLSYYYSADRVSGAFAAVRLSNHLRVNLLLKQSPFTENYLS